MSNSSGLLVSIHVWSTKQLIHGHVVQDASIDIYHEKILVNVDCYSDLKKLWAEGRGIPWYPMNKRPDKLRNGLAELEELLDSNVVVHVKWRSTHSVQFVLANGTLISVVVSTLCPAIEKISIDRSLVGKFSDHVYSAILEDNFLAFSFLENPKLAWINFSKKPSTEKKDIEKLAAMEPKIIMRDVPGASEHKSKRNVISNCRADMICVWWALSSEDAWPWSPVKKEVDRPNLVLMGVTSGSSPKLDILTYMLTDGDLLNVSFCFAQPNQLLTVEQSATDGGLYRLELCGYEFTGSKLAKMSSTKVAVGSPVLYLARNHAEDKIVFICEDGKMVLWDDSRSNSLDCSIGFTASLISWHPTDTVFAVASHRAEIQVFDVALNSMLFLLRSDSLGKCSHLALGQYFSSPMKLSKMIWAIDTGLEQTVEAGGCCDDLLLVFERGPICTLRIELGVCTQGRLGPVELVADYLRHKEIRKAVSLLSALNWNKTGQDCFHCLSLIVDYALRNKFDTEQEACIEDSLGCFYAPPRPLAESSIIAFRDEISRLARRFFHQLLRHERFEKAFLLAVDIGSKELFMDIFYLASDVGNYPLANSARERAAKIHENEAVEPFSDVPSDYLSDDLSDQVRYTSRQMRSPHASTLQSRFAEHMGSYAPARHQNIVSALEEFKISDSDDEFVTWKKVETWDSKILSARTDGQLRPETSVEDELELTNFGLV